MVKAGNCIDLHIKASRELVLERPIKIRVKDEDIVISTAIVLQTNVGKILIASQRNAPKLVETNVSPYTLQNDSRNDYNSADMNGYSSVEHLQRTDAPSVTRSNDYSQMRQPNISNQRAVKTTDLERKAFFEDNFDNVQVTQNDPDIVKSTKLPFSMPSRYVSENSLYPNRNNSDGQSHHLEENRPLGQTQPRKIQQANIPKPSTDSYDDRTSKEKIGNYKDFDNTSDLPYSDLTPSYQMNFGKPGNSKQTIPDEKMSNELPYSDLEPSHKKNGRKGNNFDVLRSRIKRKEVIMTTIQRQNIVLSNLRCCVSHLSCYRRC